MSSPRLPLSSRPTFLPDEISRREFATVFRGYDPSEVRTFLNQLAEQSADLADRVAEIQKALAETEERIKNPELTEEMVTQLLGEQTAQILRSAREAAAETRRKTDEEVGRQLRDAHEVTSRMKDEAETLLRERTEEAGNMAETMRNEANEYSEQTRNSANEYAEATRNSANEYAEATRNDADQDASNVRNSANEDASNVRNEVAAEAERRYAELESEILRKREYAEREINEERTRARQESRDLIDTARMEAQALVERTQARQGELIEGLVRRRKIALAQLDSLRAGRQRLLGAYKMVRSTLDDVTAELEKVEEEARQAGVQAGTRAAETADLEPAELDQTVELEEFQLEDDVPESIINLAESEQHVVSSWNESDTQGDDADVIDMQSIKVEGAALFDLESSQYDDEDDTVVNLTVIEGQESNGAPRNGEHASRPIGLSDIRHSDTMTRELTEQQQSLVVDTDIDSADDDEETSTMSGPTALIIGEAYAGEEDNEDARALKLRRDAVISKARSQAVRRLKRALQDEQDNLIGRMRSNEFRSVQALLGSPDDQAASYHRAVVKLLREVTRTAASSVPGSTGVERGTIDRTGTAAARGLADQVVVDLRERVVPVLESALETEDRLSTDVISNILAEPYGYMKGDYLDHLVDERVGMVFDEGVELAR